ncbi:MAG: hypothetical protein FJ263_08715 [Planctomycetes bacterium]|nr:hypothetical protein [Planctomycetota bacterium]
MTKHIMTHLTTIIWAAFCLSGCASRESLNRQEQSFLLEIAANVQPQTTAADGTLKIRYCRAAAPFDSQYFLYRTQDSQYQQDYYKKFLTPPNEQITEQLRIWLEQGNVFHDVLSASTAATAEYILESHLLAMYADFSDPAALKTVLKMHFILVKMNNAGRSSTVIMDTTYESKESFEKRTGGDIVKNYNSSLETIFARLQSDIVRSLK